MTEIEIEIVTTKKKLTKNLIEQMREIKLDEMEDANVLGFINGNPKLIIVEIDRFEYRKIYWSWQRGGVDSVYRTVKKAYTTEIKFKSGEDREKFMLKLDEFKNEALQIYI